MSLSDLAFLFLKPRLIWGLDDGHSSRVLLDMTCQLAIIKHAGLYRKTHLVYIHVCIAALWDSFHFTVLTYYKGSTCQIVFMTGHWYTNRKIWVWRGSMTGVQSVWQSLEHVSNNPAQFQGRNIWFRVVWVHTGEWEMCRMYWSYLGLNPPFNSYWQHLTTFDNFYTFVLNCALKIMKWASHSLLRVVFDCNNKKQTHTFKWSVKVFLK